LRTAESTDQNSNAGTLIKPTPLKKISAIKPANFDRFSLALTEHAAWPKAHFSRQTF
jgi:hypothetical protein